VQSIHQGLLKLKDKDESDGFTKVKNLALFSHGETWGMGLNSSNDFSKGGLRSLEKQDGYTATLESFVKGLSGGVASGVRVELFACATGAMSADEQKKEEKRLRKKHKGWDAHKVKTESLQDEFDAPAQTKNEKGEVVGVRSGNGSFAYEMATQLGEDATVLAHSTYGHTTRNPNAVVFGKEAKKGAGEGGLSLFHILYDDAFVNEVLEEKWPGEPHADRYALVRGLMHDHYRQSLRAHKDRPAPVYPEMVDRYGGLPMAADAFVNPEDAREKLHADFKDHCLTDKQIEKINEEVERKNAKTAKK
jgi:hypothetical protein